MGVVKVLERKSVIRFFGVALTIAPFFNILLSMSVQSNVANPWTSRVFWLILKSSTFFDYFLYISSFVIGLIMLRGSTSAWKFVLFLLGGCILNQTLNLGQNARANWMAWPFFIINVGTFLFILDQLVWKEKKPAPQRPKSPPLPAQTPTMTVSAQSENSTPAPASVQAPEPAPAPTSTSAPAPALTSTLTPAPTQTSTPALALTPKPIPAPALAPENSVAVLPNSTRSPIEVQQKKVSLPPSQTAKKVVIHFEGLGPWAQLMGISKNGIHVRCLTTPPDQIETREIEMSMKDGLHFKLRFSKQSGSDLFFDFKNLTAQQIRSMNQWLTHLAS